MPSDLETVDYSSIPATLRRATTVGAGGASVRRLPRAPSSIRSLAGPRNKQKPVTHLLVREAQENQPAQKQPRAAPFILIDPFSELISIQTLYSHISINSTPFHLILFRKFLKTHILSIVPIF